MSTLSLKARGLTGVVAVLAVAIFGLVWLASPAQSQTGPSTDCSGERIISVPNAEFGDRGDTVYSAILEPHSRTYSLTNPLQAGTYDLNAVSYDGYATRAETPVQAFEQWRASFLDADGNVLATSGATGDLQDGVIEATWSGPIGRISWTGPDAVTLVVDHASNDTATPNSVEPSCVGVLSVPINGQVVCEDGSTAPSAEECPVVCGDGTTVPAGQECAVPVEVLPGVIEPIVPSNPPTQVLPEIIEAPTAAPTQVIPQFAG